MLTPAAHHAFLRFEAAFVLLKEAIQFTCPIEMFREFQQLDSACRQFFDAANEQMFPKAQINERRQKGER